MLILFVIRYISIHLICFFSLVVYIFGYSWPTEPPVRYYESPCSDKKDYVVFMSRKPLDNVRLSSQASTTYRDFLPCSAGGCLCCLQTCHLLYWLFDIILNYKMFIFQWFSLFTITYKYTLLFDQRANIY